MTFAKALRAAVRAQRPHSERRPLSSRVFKYNDLAGVGGDYAPEAHPLNEAIRWRHEHSIGRTLNRSERRHFQRLDRCLI